MAVNNTNTTVVTPRERKPMKMIPGRHYIANKESSSIRNLAFDPKALELEVEFRNGKRYLYRKVEEEIWKQLKEAESTGKFVSETFVQSLWPYREVTYE